MDYSYFDKCNFEELKDIALKMDIKIPKSKSFLKLSIIDCLSSSSSIVPNNNLIKRLKIEVFITYTVEPLL